jgi:hypothetical protein
MTLLKKKEILLIGSGSWNLLILFRTPFPRVKITFPMLWLKIHIHFICLSQNTSSNTNKLMYNLPIVRYLYTCIHNYFTILLFSASPSSLEFWEVPQHCWCHLQVWWLGHYWCLDEGESRRFTQLCSCYFFPIRIQGRTVQSKGHLSCFFFFWKAPILLLNRN